MKLDKFIRDVCCNYIRTECIGVWGTKRFNDTSICGPLEKEEPKACRFFERVVLPCAIKLGCHEKLVEQYRMFAIGFKKPVAKDKRKCKLCGVQLEKGKQFCSSCQIKKAKKRGRTPL